MAFIRATQAENLQKLEADYGAVESQYKIITALKKALVIKAIMVNYA